MTACSVRSFCICRVLLRTGDLYTDTGKREEEHGTSSPLPIAGIESVLEECYEVNVKENIDLYLVPTEQGEYVNRAFSNTSNFTYIRREFKGRRAASIQSDFVGKLKSQPQYRPVSLRSAVCRRLYGNGAVQRLFYCRYRRTV